MPIPAQADGREAQQDVAHAHGELARLALRRLKLLGHRMNEQTTGVPLIEEIEHWERFVAEWCLGTAPRDPKNVVREALGAIQRSCPEYLKRMQMEPGRGLAVVSSMIHAGKVLLAVEKLVGFDKILKRVIGGEKSAWAELEFAAMCLAVGFQVVLEPPLKGRVLDCSVSAESGPVYVEVICPTTSQLVSEAMKGMHEIASELIASCPGSRTELLLDVDPTVWNSESVEAIKSLPMEDVVVQIEQGRVRKIPFDPLSALKKERFQASKSGPLLISGYAEISANEVTAAEVAMQIDDERAHRLFSAEHHQFDREATNVLVVDVTDIHDGIRGWEPLVRRWFQPERNRRVGGILLWARARAGTPMSVLCESVFILNPYALCPIPPEVQTRLSAMDESSGWKRGTAS